MSAKATLDLNGGGPSPNEPLISQQQQKRDLEMAKSLDEKEIDGAVYKSTVDKVEIRQPTKYVGLTKEELELYVNDPFWRKMRYGFLFLFWFAWIAMFAAAIIIVIMSPACPPRPELRWWQKKTCYQIWTRSFKDSNADGVGDLNGLTSQLKHMTALKTSAIWPVPLLNSKGSGGYDVLNHEQIHPELGSLEDFDALVKTAHSKGIFVIIDLPLTTVSVEHEWFKKSVAKVAGYDQFFRWSATNPDPKTWSSTPNRTDFYKHWGNATGFALLDWDYIGVRTEMYNVAKFWLDRKVDGFYLGEVQYMSLKDDGTSNWDKIYGYLNDFNVYIRNITNDRHIATFTSGGFDEPTYGITVDDFKVNMNAQAGVDYVINNELVVVNQSCGAGCIRGHLNKVVELHETQNLSWPMWELGHPHVSRVSTRMGGRPQGELLSMLLMTLPGSVNVYYGDEIGMVDTESDTNGKRQRARAPMQWSKELNAGFTEKDDKLPIPVNPDYMEVNFQAQSDAQRSTLKMFKRLASLRLSEDAVLYGKLKLYPTDDKLLVTGISSNHSTTNYLTVLNFASTNGTYNLTATPFSVNMTGQEASLVIATTNLGLRGVYVERQPVDLGSMSLRAHEGLVVKLKPKKG